MKGMWIALLVSTFFLGITALAGGVALVAGVIEPGLDLLDGSPFKDYLMPGLSLAGIGLLGLAATMMLIRGRSTVAVLTSSASGAGIVIYEVVEVLVIGPHFLQTVYALLGVAMMILAGVMLATLMRPQAPAVPARHSM